MTTIYQKDQEALKAKEEMITAEVVKVPLVAAKAAEIPLVAPVQDRGFHMTQDARERGLIIIE
jgi:hypothetical protein